MNILTSSGTGSGKSTLVGKLEIEGYTVISESSATSVLRRKGDTNMDLYYAMCELMLETESKSKFVMDRHPIDILVGSVLLGEISLIQAYRKLDKLVDQIKSPQLIIVTPIQDPVSALRVSLKKESRQKYWEKIFSSDIYSENCKVYLGMKISHSLVVQFAEYLYTYSDTVNYKEVSPSPGSNYYSWTAEASKLINSHI